MCGIKALSLLMARDVMRNLIEQPQIEIAQLLSMMLS